MIAQPSLESILSRFVTGGWQGLEGIAGAVHSPQQGEVDVAYERVCQAAARLAATDDGKILLEWILDLTLRKASWHGTLGASIEQIATYGLVREGQNSLAALILGAILKGQGAAPLTVRDTGA